MPGFGEVDSSRRQGYQFYCCNSAYRVFSYQVKSLRQFGAILLMLVACVAPAMACMAPDAQMTIEERACCRMMKSQCGQMEMPTSNDCCKIAAQSVPDTALKTEKLSFHPSGFVAIWAASFEILTPQRAGNGWIQHPEDSPPKSPPSAITILRI